MDGLSWLARFFAQITDLFRIDYPIINVSALDLFVWMVVVGVVSAALVKLFWGGGTGK